jgi:hypothetical protein
MQNGGLAPRCPNLTPGRSDFSTIDTRVLEDFAARTASLISVAKGFGARVLVVPQVGFSNAELVKGMYRWWTPYLDQGSLPVLMRAFNRELRAVAERMKVSYVDSVDSATWSDDLFVDVSHLNAQGNERLAKLLVLEIRKDRPTDE